MLFIFLFFFKQKTAYEMRISDWSSDVCSSDLNRRSPHNRNGQPQSPFVLSLSKHRPSFAPVHDGRTALRQTQGERKRESAQNTTTLRMLSPACIRSNPLLISSSPMTWVIIGSISILPCIYMSTIFGTSVRPLAPQTADRKRYVEGKRVLVRLDTG